MAARSAAGSTRTPSPETRCGDRTASARLSTPHRPQPVGPASVGRATIENEDPGVLRLYADKDGVLLGGELFGPDVEHQAHLLAWAVQLKMAYTKALAKQLIEKGIRANVVAPGPFWTVLQASGGQPTDKVTKFGEQSAFGRPGQPVEIAPVYVLLASQEGSYISGEVYGVTGGAGVA
jgi:hypothetical protein